MSAIHQVQLRERPAGSGDDAESPLRFQSADGSYFLGLEDLRLARARGFVVDTVREIDERELPVRFILPHDGAVNDLPPQSARHAVLARLLAEGRADGCVHIRFLGRNRSVPPDGFVLDKSEGARRYVWQVVPNDAVASRPGLAERFCALRSHLADPDRRVVLSLGSGGVKLFAHAAALRLIESIGCGAHLDEVWGSSGGALIALLYCHGLSPHAIEQTGYDVYSGRYELSLRPSTFQMLRHLVRDAIVPRDDAASAGFVDCSAELQRMLDQYCLRRETLRPFYCTAFNLAERRGDVLTPMEVPPHLRSFIFQTDPREAALASSSVPLLFVPRRVEIDGKDVLYIDGSTTEGVPMFSPVRKWDLDRQAGLETRSKLSIIYVKLTSRKDGGQGHAAGRMSKLRLLQTIATAGVEVIHERDRALIEARDDVELLPLEMADSSPDFFDTRRIPESIRLAKETFPDQLARLESRLRGSS